jgi:UDP-N-acetylmuramoylalanine--D-glutamate ligase
VIPVRSFQDRPVAVFGLGRSGLSTARALSAGGARVVCWDDDEARRAKAEAEGFAVAAPESWSELAALALSPGVPLTHPEPHPVVLRARALGAEVLGDVELFARERPSAVVAAVTGTNGKSTTTALIGHLLNACGRRAQVGGNLGTPVLDLDDDPGAVYVLELSSYQIDLTRSLRPAVAVLTNITPDHLDRHGGMEGYVAAKRRLLEMSGADATLVVGVDDVYCAAMVDRLRMRGRLIVSVAVGRPHKPGVYAEQGRLYAGDGRPLADLNGVESLRGAHNWQNSACAFAAVRALGVCEAEIARAMRGFPGLAHRMERIAVVDGVAFVNDSKATNADAAEKALTAYDRVHWIAGGVPKAGGIEPLRPLFGRIVRAYLIGQSAAAFARTLEGGAVEHEMSGDLARATQAAFERARRDGGGVVLLSPACASFDQFANFEQRGEAFRRIVQHLARERVA